MVTTFGEIMLRISPSIKGERVSQALNYSIEPGGSEANVAIALANLGGTSKFVTKLPNNELSRRIISFLNQFSVDTNDVSMGGERLGIYWIESGIGPRHSFVIYDRERSSFSEIQFSDIDWISVLRETKWFHTSGITPAVSKLACDTLGKVLNIINERFHVPISVDLNYRAKLWNWIKREKNEIQSIMRNICSNSTLICGNETDFQNSLGFTSKEKGKSEYYTEIAKQCFDEFPSLKYAAISQRESLSASNNQWSGFLFVRDDKNFIYKGDGFNIDNIVDRVGTGDSFTAGIIFGLQNLGDFNYQGIIDFAVSLSALKHTILGDASRFSLHDVKHAMQTKGSGRITR